MTKVNRVLLLAIILFCGAMTTQAQQNSQTNKAGNPEYKTAIGVKFYPTSLTFKTFTNKPNKAVELLAIFKDGFRLTALYEIHGDLTAEKNLKWYIGFGLHGGYYDKNDEDGIMAGADGTAGLDYKFKKLPLNLSLDWQPSLELVTPKTRFEGGRGGLSVRVAL